MAMLRRLFEIGEAVELIAGVTQLLCHCTGLGCGHCHLRRLDMLTTSAATYRGDVMAGAQGPKPQIVCPGDRLSGEAP